MLIGTTEPFTDDQLHALYPTFARYRSLMCQASAAAVRQGVLLPFDAQDIDRRVKSHRNRWPVDAQGDGDSDAECAAVSRAASAVAARRCRSARVVVVHPRLPRHARLEHVSVRVDGHRATVRRTGGRALRVSFAGRPRSTVSVAIRAVVRVHGRRRVVTDRRTYHLCLRRARGG
jgi:hypothetical protein